MKKLLLFSMLLLGLLFTAAAQTTPTQTAATAVSNVSATVQKIGGKPVFVLSEPAKEYEVVFTREIKFVLTNAQINSVDKIAETLANACARYGEKEKLEYDAIIVTGVRADAIRFK